LADEIFRYFSLSLLDRGGRMDRHEKSGERGKWDPDGNCRGIIAEMRRESKRKMDVTYLLTIA
jgi:hypothetical protein